MCRLTSVHSLNREKGILNISTVLWVLDAVLSVLTQFLSNLFKYVALDSCQSKLVNALSGVLHGTVLGPLLFLLYSSQVYSNWRMSFTVIPMTTHLLLLCHLLSTKEQCRIP